MKNITQYILEYKARVKKSFDYKAIKSAIENCKPKFFGNEVFMDLLWTPQIYFNYNNGWSAGVPRNNGEDKTYKEIELGVSTVLYLEWYAMKNLFKKNSFSGKLACFEQKPLDNANDDNWNEISKYLQSKYNAKDLAGYDYCEFNSYEELEEILKGLEKLINQYNTNYDKNNPTYLYFNYDEAKQNSTDKKNSYEILSCEEEIVKLNKQLEDVKKAASASDTDLTVLIDDINDKIKFFKDKKSKIENKK